MKAWSRMGPPLERRPTGGLHLARRQVRASELLSKARAAVSALTPRPSCCPVKPSTTCGSTFFLPAQRPYPSRSGLRTAGKRLSEEGGPGHALTRSPPPGLYPAYC